MDEGDEAPNRRRSHCGGGRRSVVRTKQQLLLAFAKVALGVDRMVWLLFVAIGLGEQEFAWCVPSSSHKDDRRNDDSGAGGGGGGADGAGGEGDIERRAFADACLACARAPQKRGMDRGPPGCRPACAWSAAAEASGQHME